MKRVKKLVALGKRNPPSIHQYTSAFHEASMLHVTLLCMYSMTCRYVISIVTGPRA